jgi:hypothetical protein
MKNFWAMLLCAVPALAAIDGTVTNQTTGKPQAGATVALYKLGGAGLEAVDQAKTDAQGKFTINQETQGGPHLLQSVYEGVTYNHMLPPGSPASGLKLDVYNASRTQPPGAKVAQHMILFEPGNGQLAVSETYILRNDGKITWNDPDGGTVKFYLPAAAKGVVQVNCTAPQGMPVRRAAEQTGRGDAYKVDFAVKPGETRIDVAYLVPFAGGSYAGKLLMKDEATRLVTPAGVTLAGDNLTSMGPEPQSKANIYDLKGSAFNVAISGTGSLRAAQGGDGSGDAAGGQQENAGPSLEQIMPKVNENAEWIVGLALGILALGFALLYRSSETESQPVPAKETNDRRRR